MNTYKLNTQQYYTEEVNGSEAGSWQTISTTDTGEATCPEVDLHPVDVGEGTFRLQVTDAAGDVLDTSEQVTL